jgi:hypothetical protein
VSTESAPQKRTEFLRKFYKKFSPDSIDKVDGLVKKADTPRKMATLVGKLVKKFYPRTIQKIKDPQQEMMEKLMKQNKDKEKEEEAEEDIDIQEL